jgi:hypothetical protein
MSNPPTFSILCTYKEFTIPEIFDPSYSETQTVYFEIGTTLYKIGSAVLSVPAGANTYFVKISLNYKCYTSTLNDYAVFYITTPSSVTYCYINNITPNTKYNVTPWGNAIFYNGDECSSCNLKLYYDSTTGYISNNIMFSVGNSIQNTVYPFTLNGPAC